MHMFALKGRHARIAVISAAGLMSLTGCEVRHAGERHTALERIATINIALELYKKDHMRCPTATEGWELVLNTYGLPESLRKDPWGHRFSYSISDSGLKCQVYSFGQNGVDDRMSGDDLVLSVKR